MRTSNPAILTLWWKITFHIGEVGLMTDVGARSPQEAVYMGMKEKGSGVRKEGGVAVPPKKKLEDYCIE